MTNTSNGASQYLVLDSLSQGSKYGLEIIEYISNKTGGNIIMKKPTLYSCLTRMEKKGLVSSSFWGESEMGGKRHYYNITNQGKDLLPQLESVYGNFSFAETSELAVQKDDAVFITDPVFTEEKQEKPSTIVLQQDNIFDLVKQTTAENVNAEEKQEKSLSTALENQIDLFSFQERMEQESEKEESITQTTESQISTPEDLQSLDSYQTNTEQAHVFNDAKFLDESEKLTTEQEAQNKRLYDTSSELKKFRKRKSFSENQIEMSVVYENEQDQEIQRSRIEELKSSMLHARENQYQAIKTENKTVESNSVEAPTQNQHNNLEEIQQDDAVYITTPRIDDSEIPFQKRITPPNIEVDVTDANLPAPKRNSSLEPTYKDMMSKLFERKKEPPVKSVEMPDYAQETTQISNFTDYDTLKAYYNTHGIEFKEYHKCNVERHHNTNFLNFISSIFLFMLSGIGSAIIFGIIAGTNLLVSHTNFMFYTIPILFAVFSIFEFVYHKVYASKKAVQKYNSIINWAVFLLSTVIVVIANVLAGMQYEIVSKFLTTLLMPTYALLLIFPINYYIKKFLYKKFAK